MVITSENLIVDVVWRSCDTSCAGPLVAHIANLPGIIPIRASGGRLISLKKLNNYGQKGKGEKPMTSTFNAFRHDCNTESKALCVFLLLRTRTWSFILGWKLFTFSASVSAEVQIWGMMPKWEKKKDCSEIVLVLQVCVSFNVVSVVSPNILWAN